MSTILQAGEILLPLLYGAAWVLYAWIFFRGGSMPGSEPGSEPGSRPDSLHASRPGLLSGPRSASRPGAMPRRAATPLLAGTAFLHAGDLALQAAATRRCPMGNFAEILSVLGFAVVVVYLILEARQRNRSTGVFLLGLVVPIMIVSAALAPPPGPTSPLLKSPLFGIHTLLALLGYAAFIVGAVYGVMFLLLHRALKRQVFGLVFDRLPSLEDLAGMTVHAAVLGFLALTVTIGVGVVWGASLAASEQIEGSVWTDPKLFLTILVWAVYGLGILTRYVLRWSNRRAVVLFLAAFAVAVLAVVALNTVLPTFHRFRT